MAYEKNWQFDTNRLYVPGSTPPPLMLNAVAVAGGGTFASNTTYQYAITATKNGCESLVSNEQWAISPISGTIVLTWTAVPGATAYTVYRGTISRSYSRWMQLGNVLTYVDTNAMNVSSGITGTPYNYAPETSKYALWYYKAFLTGQIGGATLGLWTVAGSSDSVTGAMDGVDRWGPTFDGTKIYGNAAGTFHSWVCLKSPLILGHNYYILIDFNSNSAYQASFSLVADAAPTGGSNTTAPTTVLPATISPFITLTSASASYYPAGAFRLHGALASDGSFNILTSRNGSGRFVSGFLFHLLANYRPADQFPCWMSFNLDYTLGSMSSSYGGTKGNSNSLDSISNAMMRSPNNSGFDFYSVVLPVVTNWPDGEDRFDLSYADWPCWVSKKTGTNIGTRGRLQDITFLAGTPDIGTTDDPISPKYVSVGGLWRFPIDQRILWE